jgi:hypothetical protein
MKRCRREGGDKKENEKEEWKVEEKEKGEN